MSRYSAYEEALDMADSGYAFSPSDFDIDPASRHLTIDRACHYRTCGVCRGTESVTFNPSHNGDPQQDQDVPCPNPDCEGGDVIVWRDPLLRLKAARRWARSAPRGAMHYGQARQEAVSPECLP